MIGNGVLRRERCRKEIQRVSFWEAAASKEWYIRTVYAQEMKTDIQIYREWGYGKLRLEERHRCFRERVSNMTMEKSETACVRKKKERNERKKDTMINVQSRGSVWLGSCSGGLKRMGKGVKRRKKKDWKGERERRETIINALTGSRDSLLLLLLLVSQCYHHLCHSQTSPKTTITSTTNTIVDDNDSGWWSWRWWLKGGGVKLSKE